MELMRQLPLALGAVPLNNESQEEYRRLWFAEPINSNLWFRMNS
jgi:hypothetical protein